MNDFRVKFLLELIKLIDTLEEEVENYRKYISILCSQKNKIDAVHKLINNKEKLNRLYECVDDIRDMVEAVDSILNGNNK